jgi:hypothetical protein
MRGRLCCVPLAVRSRPAGTSPSHVRSPPAATVFLEYLTGIRRYLRFSLISTVDFYYVINKLIILVPASH